MSNAEDGARLDGMAYLPLGTGDAYFGASGCLYLLATKAYERIPADAAETAPRQLDTLVSILFSAAALEAYVMELQRHAAGAAQHISQAEYLQGLADVLDEAERSRGSVQLKFMLAKRLLPGQPFDKGAQPYQDFDLLFQLRNAIVHLKPQDATTEPHRLVVQLAARKLCERSEPRVLQSWLDLIETRAVARWACNIVPAMVNALSEGLAPNSLESCVLNLNNRFRHFDRVA